MCSIQRTFPSTRKATSLTLEAGSFGDASQWIRDGSVVSPSSVEVTWNGGEPAAFVEAATTRQPSRQPTTARRTL
jgi:hypothetical protein